MSKNCNTSLYDHRDVFNLDELHEESSTTLSRYCTGDFHSFQHEEHDMRNNGHVTTMSKNCNCGIPGLHCLDQNTKRAQQRARQPSCPQREQKLRNLHSFLHCHDPAPSNHLDDVHHDLWHWSTICSASPAITLMMSSMICGTGTPQSAPRRTRRNPTRKPP